MWKVSGGISPLERSEGLGFSPSVSTAGRGSCVRWVKWAVGCSDGGVTACCCGRRGGLAVAVTEAGVGEMQHVRTTTGTLLREGGREKHCSQKHCHLGRLRSDDDCGDRVGETVMVLGLCSSTMSQTSRGSLGWPCHSTTPCLCKPLQLSFFVILLMRVGGWDSHRAGGDSCSVSGSCGRS